MPSAYVCRVAVLVRKRMKCVEDALASKSGMEEDLLVTSKWLDNMQQHINHLTVTVGHTEQDANHTLQLIKVSTSLTQSLLVLKGPMK